MELTVETEVWGARCKACDYSIFIYRHCEPALTHLTEFIKAHHEHKGFAYTCKITAPLEMVNDQYIEIAFIK